MNQNHAIHDYYLDNTVIWWWHEYPAVGRRLLSLLGCSHGKENKFWGIVSSKMWFNQFFFRFKNTSKKSKYETPKTILRSS
jgi:hypothetical protein